MPLASLESVVRPVQSPSISPQRTVVNTGQSGSPVVHTITVSGGQPHIVQGHYSLAATWYMTKQTKEKKPKKKAIFQDFTDAIKSGSDGFKPDPITFP